MSNIVYRRCCGMDVHKDTIVVCVLPPDGADGIPARKTYRTFRNDLARMRGWLKLLKVTEIAMESTGVYWRPVWNILEDHGFRLLLVNPAQVKALQGRKSDRRDAMRIAEYLQDGRLDPMLCAAARDPGTAAVAAPSPQFVAAAGRVAQPDSRPFRDR
jgi:transposase